MRFLRDYLVSAVPSGLTWRLNVKDASPLRAGIDHAGVTATFLQPVKATPLATSSETIEVTASAAQASPTASIMAPPGSINEYTGGVSSRLIQIVNC